MDECIAKKVLTQLKGPNSDDVVALFCELFRVSESRRKLSEIRSDEDIKLQIEKLKKKVSSIISENELYAKKIAAISEILGLIVIKPQKSQFSVFKRRNEKYKSLCAGMLKETQSAREKLAEKPKISPNVLSSKKITDEMREAIAEYIKSEKDVESKKREALFFNQTQDANGYALLDEVKDLHNICSNQGLPVSAFDQAHFMSCILGI